MQGKLKSFEKKMYKDQHEKWDGPHGVMYKFTVVFDNGDEGTAMSPKISPAWSLGHEYTYEKSTSDKGFVSIKGMKDLANDKGALVEKAGTNKWVDDPFENACISMEASLESASTLLRKNVMATPNNLAEAEYGLELVAKKFFDYIVFNLTLDKKDRNARIIRASALKRAVDLYEVKVFDIKNSDDVVARAKKIEEFIIKSCK